MESLHQLAELFQKEVTKNNNTSNSVAPPKMTPTRKEPQAKIPPTTPMHDAHSYLPNIIQDDDGNQPQKLDHRNQPLGLGLPPQRNNSRPHYTPPDSATYPRVAPSLRVEHTATLRRYPQLAAQHIINKYTEEPPAHNMRSNKVPMKSSTQEAILAYLNTVPRKLAPRRLAQRRFPLKMFSAVLDEDTGYLME